MDAWQLWILSGIVLGIAEVYVPGFFLACLAAGCLASGLGAYLGLGLEWQIATFSGASLLAFVTLRPLLMRFFHDPAREPRTNVDALAGCQGLVSQAIGPAGAAGRVLLRGDDWRAISEAPGAIARGSRVRVLGVDGATLLVEAISNHEEGN